MQPEDTNRSLTVIEDAALPASPPAPVWDTGSEEPPVPLTHYLWILRRHLWKMVGFVTGCVLLTLIISARMTPIYESTSTVDIDRRMPTGIVGQEAVQSLFNDSDQYLATQVSLIQSDSVLRPVALKYQLLERDEESGGAEAEKIAQRMNSPILLKQLKVSRPPNTYLLKISYRSSDPQLAADVANSLAQSYLEHTYKIRYKAASGLSQFMEKQLEELRAKMERSSAALANYEKELNIINPEEKTNILSARLIEMNSEFTKAQAARVAAEAAFESMDGGSLDAALASNQGEDLRNLTDDLHTSERRFAEVTAHFGPNHPEYLLAKTQLEEIQKQVQLTSDSIATQTGIEYRRALARERILEQELQKAKAESDAVNASSFEYQSLKREADGDKDLYEELLRKIREATINASFQNSSARIADVARPAHKPVFPKTKLNMFLAFVLASCIAVGVAVVADAMDTTIRDPEQVNRVLGIHVLGSLPQVKPWKGHLVPVQTLGLTTDAKSSPKAASRNLSTYEEAVRTLRNSILLSDFDKSLRTMLVTSASPSEGKSTIAIHLAMAHAQQHHRTLLIDGDLRRPSVHKRFDASNVEGLSNVLVDGQSWKNVILNPKGVPNLDILPAGSSSPRRAADLLGKSLTRILEEAAAEYDLVVVDAPPLLGFPEPLQMAASVDGVIVVARAGETNRKGVATVLSTLKRIRANVVGLVLNEVHRQISDSYYYYGYYGKYYKHYNSHKES